MKEDGICRAATFSPCNLYRYSLTRKWSNGALLTFVMLNPSTADHEIDDPTIRRCIAFAKRESCGAVNVVNLFGLRATDPRELAKASDPHGPGNFDALQETLRESKGHGSVICAWGANKSARPAAFNFIGLCGVVGIRVWCLGKTSDGSPRHPLYVKGDQPFVAFP